MKFFVSITCLISLNIYAADGNPFGASENAGPLVENLRQGNPSKNDDERFRESLKICGSLSSGDFSGLLETLENDYGTTLEDAYFKIRCKEVSILENCIKQPYIMSSFRRQFDLYFIRNRNPDKSSSELEKTFAEIIMERHNTFTSIERIEGYLKLPYLEDDDRQVLLRVKKRYCNHLNKLNYTEALCQSPES